ncbi:MAG TPA: guanylate kinase [Candidatus Methylomirabilis sp.]|nr:guanylate kinase [Candidatus Methylomirabilis sp.]
MRSESGPETSGRQADLPEWGRAGPLLVVVSAPSGAGKTSLCEWVIKAVPGLAHSVSYTTRPPRPDERDGQDYHFVDPAVFQAMVDRGEFAEWAVVHGHLYGTSRALLERYFAAGQDVILDIDTLGAAILRKAHPDAAFVFIVPPSWALLEERLRLRRSDAEAEIQRRLQRAREEVRHYAEYQYIIVNDVFARAAEELKAIILAERRRSSRVDLGFLQT